jgi:hypothetical protein
MLAAAKALADMARESKVLAIRGGVLEGRVLSAEEVESLASLPPVDILRGQVLGAIVGPLTALLGLVTAPVQNLYGLIEARIEQLGGDEGSADAAPEPEPTAEVEPPEAEEDTQATATAVADQETTTEEEESE